VRYLQASQSALETFCMALAASHPQPAKFRSIWQAMRTQLDVDSLELEAMQAAISLISDPAPEDTQFRQDALHALDRGLERALARSSE
jgi:hypothetical protein